MVRCRLVVAVFLALSASGCSVIARAGLPLFYSLYFDNLVEDRLTGFMDLTDEQDDFVDERVDAYVSWHRSTMLPRYATELERQAALIRRGSVSREEVESGEAGFRSLWIQSVSPLSEWASMLMVQQNAEQLEYMEREWRKRHKDDTEIARKPKAERIEEATDRISDAFDDFLVDVEEPQEREIRRWMTEVADRPQRWIGERKRRWKVLMEKLRAGAAQPEIQSYLALLYADPARLGSDTYRAEIEQARELFRTFLTRFFTTLSAEQREQFAENLEELAEDFRELADG